MHMQDINPNFFLALLLPLILYAAAISMHWYTLRRCLFQVCLTLLTLPATVVTTIHSAKGAAHNSALFRLANTAV